METEHQKQIKQLFEPKFVIDLIAKANPDFAKNNDLSDLTITPIKHNIGAKSHHVVVRYDSASIGDKPIFCSSSSDASRENAFNALKFVNNNGFKNTGIFLPKPLLYKKELNAFFYQGVDGENLLYYIKQDINLTEYAEQTAKWIAYFHSIPTKGAEKLNSKNSRIKTIIPGPDKFLKKIEKKFPKHFKDVKNNFKALVEWENKNFKTLDKLCLIHGDFHPENVIINKTDGKISGIDFTDICLADFTRDIGNFLQQLGFMSKGKRETQEIEKYKDTFLKKYLETRKIEKTKEIEKRINMYIAYAALRSAIYFLVKGPPEPDNAFSVLKECKTIIEQNI